MTETPALSVVVPVKDEAGNAAPLAREIAAALRGEDFEIVFVDDGSTDSTVNELIALKHELPIRIVAHSRNLGQSRAIRTGVRAARSGLIVTLDGDGQNDPADVPRLVRAFRTGAHDPRLAMIAGERKKRQDNFGKRFASRFANGFRRTLLKDTANDTGCGLKVFRKDAFLALPYFDHMHRYLITLLLREGHEVRFMPVGHRPRVSGRSKYGNLDRALVGIVDVMGVRWLQRRFKGPDEPKEL